MAITFTNVFKDKILDTIRKFLTTEFAGAITVYTGTFKNMGNQSIRLTPVGNDLVTQTSGLGELRDYIVDIGYYFKEKTLKRDVWEHILRQVSRIENLFDDNRNNTYLDGRLVSMRINEKTAEEEEIEGLNVVKWEFRGKYFSNQS
tara:strand:+ start:1205 stop:1642 length:438 start_codon:yes stop_codon:yes gene_type:complete